MQHTKKIINIVDGIEFCNPTGGPVRMDSGGSGKFGAPRGGRRLHNGLDFGMVGEEYILGYQVLMPVAGKILRVSYPYAGDFNWRGVEIISPRVVLDLWYMVPILGYVGSDFELPAGAPIGFMQNIGEKYPKCTPHVHMRIKRIDPALVFLIG
jgi:hypothetical protein